MRLCAVVPEFGDGNVGEVQGALVAVTLMFQIVDGEDRRGLADWRVAQDGVEHQRNEAGRPIVTVHDIGDPPELLTKRQGPAAKKREAQVVVGMIAPRSGINFGSVKKLPVFDAVERDI